MSVYANLPEEVREHAKWLPSPYHSYGECSNCGMHYYNAMPCNANIFRYCPNCGARMDLIEDGTVMQTECAAAVPPLHRGRWFPIENEMYSPFDGSDQHKYVCSWCGSVEWKRRKFCPECGARMNMEEEK